MPDSQSSHTTLAFPKSQKLCGETTIDRLFREGTGFSRFPIRVVYIINNERRAGEHPLRMMVSVGKKRFKRANKRNRVKRLVREAWRHHKDKLQTALETAGVQGMHVAIVFLANELPTYDAVDSAVAKVIDKLASAALKHTAKEG